MHWQSKLCIQILLYFVTGRMSIKYCKLTFKNGFGIGITTEQSLNIEMSVLVYEHN